MSGQVQEAFLRVGAHHGETQAEIQYLQSLFRFHKSNLEISHPTLILFLLSCFPFFSVLLQDPSLNHKAYREAFKRMKPPKIPFMPLLLKGSISSSYTYTHTARLDFVVVVFMNDTAVPCFNILDITFIHEGNKTFHDNLVNFEKLVSALSQFVFEFVFQTLCRGGVH